MQISVPAKRGRLPAADRQTAVEIRPMAVLAVPAQQGHRLRKSGMVSSGCLNNDRTLPILSGEMDAGETLAQRHRTNEVQA
jgi:hypothetical protein